MMCLAKQPCIRLPLRGRCSHFHPPVHPAVVQPLPIRSMPDILAGLTRCSDNEILDHLRWHIVQGRMPSSIEADPAHSVVVFRFPDRKQWRHEIASDRFEACWKDARAVVASIPTLPQMAKH